MPRVRRGTALLAAIATTALAVTIAIGAPKTSLKHPPGRFINANGAKLWVETEGDGEPLLLIAGGPGFSHSYFHPFHSALANNYRLIYFDALGTGRSDRAQPAADYTVDRDVENIEALRAALQLERLNIFGHSYGGMVAQVYAVKHPDRVKKLIIADAVVAWGGALQQIQDHLNELLREQMPERAEKLDALRATGVRSSAKEHQEAYEYPGGMVFFRNPENGSKLPRNEPQLYNPDVWYAMAGNDADYKVEGDVAHLDVRAALKELKMPILVIGGRFDRMVPPALVMAFREYAPQAQIVIFEKSGHFPFVEEPEATFALIRKFLD